MPIQLAKGRDDEQRQIELECTLDDAQAFESVHEAAYPRLGDRPAEDPDWDIGIMRSSRCRTTPVRVTQVSKASFDARVPGSHVLRPRAEGRGRGPRASAAHLADGHSLGEVDGFVVDADEHITHFVLERGHLWGRKEVTIPIGAVARVESDVVHVALWKDEVGALAAVRVGRHG